MTIDPSIIKILSRKIELEQKISDLKTQIDTLVVERKARAEGFGNITAIIGTIMIFTVSDIFGFIIMLIGEYFSYKTPSKKVVKNNIALKQKLIKQQSALQEELNLLNLELELSSYSEVDSPKEANFSNIDSTISDSDMEKIRSLIRDGYKLGAIKMVIEITGWSLAEAKTFVETMISNQ